MMLLPVGDGNDAVASDDGNDAVASGDGNDTVASGDGNYNYDVILNAFFEHAGDESTVLSVDEFEQQVQTALYHTTAQQPTAQQHPAQSSPTATDVTDSTQQQSSSMQHSARCVAEASPSAPARQPMPDKVQLIPVVRQRLLKTTERTDAGVGRPVGADAAQRAGARSEGKRTMVDYVLRPQTGMKPKPKPKPKRSLRQRQLTRTVLPEEHPQYSVQADGEEAAVRHGAAINDGHDHDDDDATAAAMARHARGTAVGARHSGGGARRTSGNGRRATQCRQALSLADISAVRRAGRRAGSGVGMPSGINVQAARLEALAEVEAEAVAATAAASTMPPRRMRRRRPPPADADGDADDESVPPAPRPRPAFDMRRHIKRARGGAEASQLQSHQDDAAAGAADNRQQREPHVARFMKRTRISPAEAVELLGALQL
eukprot:jgi/Chrzof1/15061/Cz09g25200.t1